MAAHLNIAHVQAEVCSDNAAAIETLSKLINSGLGGTSPIASRGILEARSGRIEQALADAQSASSSKPTALEMLQVAGIYAIISKQTGVAAAQQDAIRDLGLVWLARSLAADPGLRDLAASDPDLVNLGGLPTFKALVGVRSH